MIIILQVLPPLKSDLNSMPPLWQQEAVPFHFKAKMQLSLKLNTLTVLKLIPMR